MIAAAIDTHALLWHLYDDPAITGNVTFFIEEARIASSEILVPSICCVEIAYLVEKQRVPSDAFERIAWVLRHPDGVFTEAPLTLPLATTLRRVHRQQIPDMPDRIIAATALHFGVPLITCNERIRASNIPTIW